MTLLATLGPAPAPAGGGPETTLLVVNADSPLSVRIANAYARLRDIPASHIAWLEDVPSLERISVDQFRERIWRPIRAHMEGGGLEDAIDLIVYSTDFPYAVDLSRDIKRNNLPRDRHRGNIASLTGVTFFAHQVEAGSTDYLNLHANQYFRRDLSPRPMPPRPPTPAERTLKREADQALERGQHARAAAAYQELTRSYPWPPSVWSGLARARARLGRTDAALDALARAVQGGWANSFAARDDPHLKPLRGHPRFEALLEEMDASVGPFEPAHGFRSRYVWSRSGLPMDPAVSRDRYYLATMLAHTGLRGNSLPEVLAYLERSVASDGTHPDGTVYLMENRNVRSRARQPFFQATVRALRERGRKVEILSRRDPGQNGVLPQDKDDVVGVVAGTNRYDWARSDSRMLSGAVAESLTSYGAHFYKAKQTKLSEFLRHGAAGSSGAVAEPYSIHQKFPLPLLHAYYADGCSLAEAFYQSIAAPYQLLVVGDPLARPFARFADVRLAAPDPDRAWRGTVSIRPEVRAAPGRRTDRVELWVDGRPVAEAAPGEPLAWDTTTVADGEHELRLVAVDADAIETRSYARHTIAVRNAGRRVLAMPTRAGVSLGERIELTGVAPGAQRVTALRGARALASVPVEEDRWRLALPSEQLGIGEAAVAIRADYPDGTTARSPLVRLWVDEPAPLEGRAQEQDGRWQAGLAARPVAPTAGPTAIVERLDGRLAALEEIDPAGNTIHLRGQFRVETTGFYQLTVESRGPISLAVNERRVLEHAGSDHREHFAPLALRQGWHTLALELNPSASPYARIVLAGADEARILGGERLRHTPAP